MRLSPAGALHGQLSKMAPGRIPFRSRKAIKNENLQNSAVSLRSSDGGLESCKKRKSQLEDERISQHKSKVTLHSSLHLRNNPSLTAGIVAKGVEVGEGKAIEQITAAFSSLLEVEAITAAIEHLKCCDSKLREVIECSQFPKFQSCNSPFRSLVRSIVYQQLATNAAAAIYKRLLLLSGGEDFLTPAVISNLSPSDLRGIGISARKASYLHDLSKNFLEGGLSDTSIMLMEDNELLTALTAVKGIGVWSVHMFMIFSLHRPDVLPVSDLGVRKGFSLLYNLKSLPNPSEMEKLSAPWRPYRSLGAWYMWRLIERKPALKAKGKG
ncbi:hypothetical protein KP509_17G025900 [Ceratopteris richardii]|uniref:HhH-GPD domain-containing protein n=1 Tax=Ceratopteris richardii TaxID=49495 RepID=A0A8T2SWU2_CERRI|nr:hypothetical protein KP509_17G025900 [Ceratopteris richardii]